MMSNTEIRELVYLAGLLHDKQLQKLVNLPDLPAKLPATDSWLNSLLHLADSYATGTNKPIETKATPSNKLESVFQNLDPLTKSTKPYYFPMKAVSLDESFFPQQLAARIDEKEENILWKALEDEIQKLSGLSVASLTESLLYLLEKYAVTIPCGKQHLPDVSLYDHAKSTAALTLCLYDYLNEGNRLVNSSIDDTATPVLLIGGDLSGIQVFIYDIIGRSAAKNLKGRSFYLQLIVDSIVQHLLDGLNLYRANVIYSSGGGFYLLAPNTGFVREMLPQLQQEIAAKLREEQGIRLFLAIDSQPVSQAQVFGDQINEAWSGLTQKLAAQKKRKFAPTLPNSDYAYFFDPSEVGGESRGNRDAVTSEEFVKGEKKYPLGLDDDDANLHVRKSTFEQVRLGRTLRERIQYVVKSTRPIADWEPDERTFGEITPRYFTPLALKSHYYFIGDKQLDKFRSKAKSAVNDILVQRVNHTDSSDFSINGQNQVHGFTFYGGNNIPRHKNEDAKYFEELAGPESLNFKRLGILRMDVDNLGFLFKNGFSGSKRTFSRYSTLSRQLDYFFKGYLNTIRESDEDFKQYTFILYAGGDDLFIVGKWDATLRFAERIQREFAAWTCQSPRLGISGGVAVVPAKFPIAKAADQSADQEKKAKNHDLKDSAGKTITEKSSICLFGTPLGWGEKWATNNGLSEWQIVTELKNDLKQHIDGEKNIPKSLISKISTLYTMKQEQEKNGQNPSWRWLSAYDLGRARERAKSKEAQAFFDQLKTDLFTDTTYKGNKLTGTNYGFLDLLNVAARWAELEMRSDDKQTD